MTADDFRKDKYLRATGYNFYVWAAVNVLVTWPLYSALGGSPWPGWLAGLYPLGLIVAGIFLSVLNDNRVQKMCGDPNPTPLVEAGAIWGPIFLIGFLLTVVFAVRGPAAYIQPLWLCLVGAAYLMWGNFGVREFRFFGWALAIAGGVAGMSIRPADVAPHLASSSALAVWVVFMGVLWIPFGAYINRKYVHSRPREAPRLEPSGAADRAP
jgi:lysylphosphatidylglycerol synthetase-like protein (DUF2156 family)